MEPLDTYIPPVLAARGQLVESLELLDDAANAETARQMLRKGRPPPQSIARLPVAQN
jgi:hypothetical protein